MQFAGLKEAAAALKEVPAGPKEAPPRAERPRMMRQYELVDRVKRYNPNADEVLLNRAYVYAMRAHGQQTRASGEAYFAHPLEVAAILTDLKLEDAHNDAPVLHDTVEESEATLHQNGRCF